ncbi:hypothetical protein ST47_g1024 [Ascochyta rabiei]|uniref:Uncharacterized protein n=1 Tax=Didymella rabiei TaxID=5454 RepID=A0A163LJ09_DIDRA|nr:hypothetical protein ST47_g1024 [Ascochyta rabiei]
MAPNNLPESSELDIRDYLYIDRQRVGSLLAQLIEGLPEERSEARTRSRRIDLGLRRVASVGKDVGENSSQTLALADLHVSQLKESAEALGLLADVSGKMSSRKFWLRGKVRARARPGMLLRVSAPTQLSDIASIAGAFRRLNGALSDQPSELEQVLDALEALYGDSITVSVRTADPDDYEVGFVGEIPHVHEYGPMRRELLLSQVGSDPTELTTLMQIAAIPTCHRLRWQRWIQAGSFGARGWRTHRFSVADGGREANATRSLSKNRIPGAHMRRRRLFSPTGTIAATGR